MKKLVVVLAATVGLLSGCVGYAVPYDNGPGTVYRGDGGHRIAGDDQNLENFGLKKFVDIHNNDN